MKQRFDYIDEFKETKKDKIFSKQIDKKFNQFKELLFWFIFGCLCGLLIYLYLRSRGII